MTPELGIIEGFYGKPWSWSERQETVRFLAPHGYRFYLYCPKADPWLRRRWQEPHPAESAQSLAQLSNVCSDAGVRFGIGLSPYNAFLDWNDEARAAFAEKLQFFDDIGVTELAILFDDMRGDVPRLAETQVEIVEWAAARTRATRLVVCPTYYSDDPVLDRVFGERPPDYLPTLGRLLDRHVELFWTGPEVCSREISTGHLQRVTELLQRKPLLWDNYPVNDGQRMSQYLHVRGFTGRPAAIAGCIAAHGINPALQPTLSRVPALTLVDSYTQGDAYDYGRSQLRAARTVLGDALGARLHEDTLFLQDVGLDRLDMREATLRERWTSVDHPAAREILDWLNGDYRITNEIVETQ